MTEIEKIEQQTVRVARTGTSFGCMLAVAISWSVNQSIWWAIVHGICSWGYVIYFAIWGRA